MTRQSYVYEVDPYNRLVVGNSTGKSLLPKFRTVLDGQFKIDADNNLYYHIKAPVQDNENIPNQLRLKGEWSLTKDHDLRFTFERSSRTSRSSEITIQGQILDVKENSLLFAVTTLSNTGTQTSYVLTLQGSWKACQNNRLAFQLRKERGKYDILSFSGAWEIGPGYELIYKYEKAELARKTRTTQTLVFKGHWDVTSDLEISYLLGADSRNAIIFKAVASLFEKNYIKYQVAITFSGGRKPVERSIELEGIWRIDKDTGLVFQTKYGDGSLRSITFGASVKLTDLDTISFKLRSNLNNMDMGVELELSRKFLKGDAEAFLRFIKDKQETAIMAGAGWRW